MKPSKVLGIDEQATVEEARAAYRKLARQVHPDVFHAEAATHLMAVLSNAMAEFAGETSGEGPRPIPPVVREALSFQLKNGMHAGKSLGQIWLDHPSYFGQMLDNMDGGIFLRRLEIVDEWLAEETGRGSVGGWW